MATVTIKGVTGFWNGKTYKSEKADHRIYVGEQELHVTKEEYQSLLDESTRASEAAVAAKCRQIRELFDSLPKEKKWSIIGDMAIDAAESTRDKNIEKSAFDFDHMFFELLTNKK
ncbi:hypothetical protein ADMFC3_12960 [Geovibrio sp. ADMFC3]